MTTDQLRDRIAALFRHQPGAERLGDATPGEVADAVLAVLPAAALVVARRILGTTTGQPETEAAPAVDRATVLLRDVLSRFRSVDNAGLIDAGEVVAFTGPAVTAEEYRRWCDVAVSAVRLMNEVGAQRDAAVARVTELEAEVARLTADQPTPGPVTAHAYQGDGHLNPCTQPGHGICGRGEYDHENA
ncbi:hypothetical protein ACGFU4_35870 [Streptomyces sp. NPDC048511]|uniref:hypothetical protein n=1 Tax=Streptomyces sp. NPDC048511 TaxID=3365562 RepID=UPI0037202077